MALLSRLCLGLNPYCGIWVGNHLTSFYVVNFNYSPTHQTQSVIQSSDTSVCTLIQWCYYVFCNYVWNFGWWFFFFYTFINFYCYLGVLIFGLDLIMICVLMSRWLIFWGFSVLAAFAFYWERVSRIGLIHRKHYIHQFAYVIFFFWVNVSMSGPQDIPYVYCVFYVTFVPLRWIYYRYKKWHYYLLVSFTILGICYIP